MASELQLPPVATLPQEQDQEGGLQLGRFVSALKRNLLLIAGVTTLTASAAALKAVTDTPTYQSSFELLTPAATLETQIISTLNPEALSNQSEILDAGVDDTRLKILTSPRVMEPIVEELQERHPSITYRSIVRSLKITPDGTGNTLTVQYQSDNSEQVIDVLEVVSEAYLRYSLEDRQNDIYRGIDFVDQQLPVVRERVDELQANLEALRQSANLIDPLVKGQELSEQTARFSSEQLDLRVEIEQTQRLYEDLQQELATGTELAANSALLQSDRYQALLNQILEVDSQLAEELTLYLDDSPEIEVIAERRANLQPLLELEGTRVQQQVESYIRELQDRDRALSQTIGGLNQRIKDLSTVAREYTDIQRELEIATANLNQFLTKREALRIDAAQRQTPWEVLTPPDEPKASSASAKRNLVLGTVLGLLLGSGAAILVDRVRGKIHTIRELKEVAQVPLLGTIPYEKLLEDEQSLTPLITQLSQIGLNLNLFSSGSNGADTNGVSSPFLEAFRILATNIQLISPDEPIRSLAISSAIPNMGKSTVSFYLAHAIAATGKKVLLVDTDLRRPTLHNLCSIANDKGLSNYASGEFELTDVYTNISLDSNLYVLPSGPVPPDSIKTLSAQRVKDLFNHIHQEFDVVIFDTPPVLGFADALMVAAQTQGILLTAMLGQIKFSQLQATLDDLSIARVPILGIVANSSKQEREQDYGYYQHYQYHQQVAVDKSSEAVYLNNSNGKIIATDWYKMPLKFLSKNLRNKR
ncbi:MAG: polysaccharide biosynthesis tyrosine autokinase [Cyanobacteria bacterium P01_D01_bin.56]